MRRVLPFLLLMALLLSGCGESTTPSETTVPTEPTETTAPPSLLTGSEGSLTTYTLDGESCAVILPLGSSYVLLTTDGQIYLLTGDELTVSKSRALGCQLNADDPSILVKEEQISYYDSARGAYVTMGKNLTEISAISIRDEMTGGPLMAADFSTVYYCTADGIRAMDMSTGNSRLLRQEHERILSMDALLFDGTILRYTRQTEDEQTQTVFIRTDDGTQTYLADLNGQLTSWSSSYAAVMGLELPMGSFRQIVTGNLDGSIMTVDVPDTWDTLLFPGDGTILLQTVTGEGVLAQLYDLNTGKILAQRTLDRETPVPHCWKEGDRLWLWSGEESAFLRWDYTRDAAEGESVLTEHRTLGSPDQTGLDETARLAQTMTDAFGIPIRITQSENRTSGVDYSGYPDYRPGQYRAALELLRQTMERFPEGFFSRLSQDVGVVIELADDFDPDLGVRSGTGELAIDGGTILRVSICQDLPSIFYHELFHAMELEIHSESTDLESWQDLNPGDFQYAGSFSAYERGELKDSPYLTEGENWFADDYALVSPREDRAQVFLYAMLPGEEARFQSPAMQLKLNMLCCAIRDAFGYEDSETVLPWEQYLNIK